jgi:RimJ/RimL family protein N-acetyltransferase
MSQECATERLLGRRPASGDRDAYRGLFLDPAVGGWLRPSPMAPYTEADVERMLREDERHWEDHGFGPWVLVDRESGSVVGRGGLWWTELDGRLEVELPWAIRSDLWGRGLATDAARAAAEWAAELGFREVIALILPQNTASRRVAEKAGFRAAGEAERAGAAHIVYRLALSE